MTDIQDLSTSFCGKKMVWFFCGVGQNVFDAKRKRETQCVGTKLRVKTRSFQFCHSANYASETFFCCHIFRFKYKSLEFKSLKLDKYIGFEVRN